METVNPVVETPWDSRALGIDTFEISSLSEEVLKKVVERPGHFTVRVHPLSSKKLLYDYGFYYCDTLIEPYCTPGKFTPFEDRRARITRSVVVDDLIEIAQNAFVYGRFHRDFNIDKELADLRYVMWLKDLCNLGDVFGLIYRDELTGFFWLFFK